MLSKRCEPCDVRVTVVFRAAPRAVAVFMANVSWVWSPALSKLTGHSWKNLRFQVGYTFSSFPTAAR